MGIKQYVRTLYILEPKIRQLCVFEVFEYSNLHIEKLLIKISPFGVKAVFFAINNFKKLRKQPPN